MVFTVYAIFIYRKKCCRKKGLNIAWKLTLDTDRIPLLKVLCILSGSLRVYHNLFRARVAFATFDNGLGLGECRKRPDQSYARYTNVILLWKFSQRLQKKLEKLKYCQNYNYVFQNNKELIRLWLWKINRLKI